MECPQSTRKIVNALRTSIYLIRLDTLLSNVIRIL